MRSRLPLSGVLAVVVSWSSFACQSEIVLFTGGAGGTGAATTSASTATSGASTGSGPTTGSGMPPGPTSGSGMQGPPKCPSSGDCSGMCPPGSLGCTCADFIDGSQRCVPTCETTQDCPPTPDGKPIACKSGACLPP